MRPVASYPITVCCADLSGIAEGPPRQHDLVAVQAPDRGTPRATLLWLDATVAALQSQPAFSSHVILVLGFSLHNAGHLLPAAGGQPLLPCSPDSQVCHASPVCSPLLNLQLDSATALWPALRVSPSASLI